MSEYLGFFAAALILTIVIEVIIAWLFRLRSKKEISTIILINLITNPLLNYLILVNHYFQIVSNSLALILLLEVGAVLAEWRLLLYVLRQSARKLLILSVWMNVISYFSGLLIFKNIVL